MSASSPASAGDSRVTELDADEALGLLAGVEFGRLACSQDALPSIRVVNHVVDDDRIIVHTRLRSLIGTQIQRKHPAAVVVAYEADSISAESQCGWSVVVTGLARLVTAPALITRYGELVRPWVSLPMDTFVSIAPEIITGIRIRPQ
ncbi:MULTISPECIES: pyridoxamine 5'-phosphate oxidase family protein [Mycobacteroides]|uniref:pyridoxamine 5'-phosphate oxidase family protein n=1 Tax=Mycobacteroides TaxID=670516 RepID=UPI0008AA4BAA|nr:MULTISPECIES: pyridoxamine 5'-phosphate oxidase family protein [Mycobacteroides]AYM40941.1 pyridoxamine 5'-phosphate oxidase family protein [[Mycobacterium] chelonae subsp. gwanakae]OHU16509.1 hypothetical protein BKG75_16285 [Mycobacteroides chelonae]TDZ91629.1 Pyridoxamine 5'-phosphate oxidase [Mycobacteroides salmoniphilum]